MEAVIQETKIFYTESGAPSAPRARCNSSRAVPGAYSRQAPPIVLIHGFPFSHEMWRPQIEALKSAYRVIAYDVRGHGRSDVGDGQYTIELFVDDLLGLLDHLKIQKAVLCGLSMGGYIALRAIERNPERVRALVLCDTRSEADSDEGKVKRSATIRTVKTQGVPAFADASVKPLFAPRSLTENPAAVETIRRLVLATQPLGLCGTLLALASRTDTTE